MFVLKSFAKLYFYLFYERELRTIIYTSIS